MADIQLFDVESYNTNKVNAVAVTATTAPGQEIVSLVTGDLPAGKYTIMYAFQVSFSTKDKTMWFGLTGDNADASMFSIAAGAADELHKNRLYGYPFDWAGGVLTTGLNFYKDASLTTGTVDFADLALKRVA